MNLFNKTPPARIHILGASGSGKTFLAKKLSRILNIPNFDLDNIYFIKRFTQRRLVEDMKRLLRKITIKKKWIVEGVYSSWVDDSIKKADLIIWLDSSPNIISWRIFKRYILRGKSRESLKDMWALIKFARGYKKREGSYYEHKKLINKHKKAYIYLKGKKEINKFLSTVRTPFIEKLSN